MAQSKSSFVEQPTMPYASQSLGDGQAWQDMLASRANNVTYTNTTGRPICVSIHCRGTTNMAFARLFVDGVSFGYQGSGSASSATTYGGVIFTSIIPAGSTYKVAVYGTMTLNKWMELR